MEKFKSFIIITILSFSNLFAVTGEGISEVGTLSSLTPNLSFESTIFPMDINQRSVFMDQNSLFLRLRIHNNDSLHIAKNIKISASINSIAMNLILNENIDITGDGLIDEIRPKQNVMFGVKSPLLPEFIENGNLIISIDSSNNINVEQTKQESISFYFAKNSDVADPFIFGKDQYNFKNYSNITFGELWELTKCTGSPLTALFMELSYSDGRCYGMAGTSGRYFLSPSEKVRDGNVFLWDSTDSKVRESITQMHIEQVAGKISTMFNNDPDSEFNELIATLKNYKPAILSMESESKDVGHSVLSTNATILHTSSKAFLGHYENITPDTIGIANYDITTKSFNYYGYDEFYIDQVPEFPVDLCDIIGGSFLQGLSSALSNDEEKIFSTACPVYLIVENEFGNRTGYLSDGTKINEIPNSEITRIASGDVNGDSLTLITVPDDSKYSVTINSYSEGTMLFEYYALDDLNNQLNISIADSVLISDVSIATFDESVSTSYLNIDNDGDGIVDSSIQMTQQVVSIEKHQNAGIPNDLLLSQNYPNPFNPVTKIKFGIPKTIRVKINIYNSIGKEIVTIIDEKMSAGHHSVNFDGSSLSSGLYFYKITAGKLQQVKKMLLIR